MTQKLRCVVHRVTAYADRVYTVELKPERPAPPFRAGQFLHLAIDPYDRSSFWPESRVFSIASGPNDRRLLRITYAVHGRFTQRMERELAEGRDVWIKMPYGDFVVESKDEVVLFAGGTGVTAFTAFLEAVEPSSTGHVLLVYGARSAELLIYREFVERCRMRSNALEAVYFVETRAADGVAPFAMTGRVSVPAVWPRVRRPNQAAFYISGPPAMLRQISGDLTDRGISKEAIHIDAWE